MKKASLGLLILLLFLGLKTESARAASSEPSTARWSAKMQEMYRTLVDILTDVSSDQRFHDPANQGRILREAKKFSALTHDLHEKQTPAPDADPTLSIVSGMLDQESKRAVKAFEKGNTGYARGLLRSLPGYCIACHTRNSSGPQFSGLPFEPPKGALSPLELGNFFTASRQFGRAMDQYKIVLQDKSSPDNRYSDWERAVQQSLAIAIRVENDPYSAQDIVDSVLKTPDAPVFLKHDAEEWAKSIAEWKQEIPNKAVTDKELRAQAMHLMQMAHQVQQYPMDRTADVLYLRASAVVHQLLQASPKGPYTTDALLLAGLCYDVLNPLGLEDLHNVYYEACVRRAPHSNDAGLCYQRFEENMFLDFTGSLGTDIPQDVRDKLVELKALANPAAAAPKN